MKKPDSFEEQRAKMVKEQLVARKIHDKRLLQAMMQVPRHLFVHPDHVESAYTDGPLPIGEGQTISQPYVAALMVAALGLQGHEKVLEIGTGSGYLAAVLGQLAAEVHSIEQFESLASKADQVIANLEFSNVHVHHNDGSAGLNEHAPYDGILVSAAAPKAPEALLTQLTPNGVLVIPVGDRNGQRLQRWTRDGDKFKYEESTKVSFVPLRGEFGWQRNAWPNPK
ncbi:MAG: protein-L-isoaspartate(D-aspartate) O-methyltransferase [Chloroflexota bacterium]